MKTTIQIVSGITLILIGSAIGWYFTYDQYGLQAERVPALVSDLQAANDDIDQLQQELIDNQQDTNSLGAIHHQNVTEFKAEIERLKAELEKEKGNQLLFADKEWEFYRGMYAGCLRFFIIGEAPYSPNQIMGICNAFTKEAYGIELQGMEDPPGLNPQFIKGLSGLDSS